MCNFDRSALKGNFSPKIYPLFIMSPSAITATIIQALSFLDEIGIDQAFKHGT